MTTIPMLPDLEPDYERTIDELTELAEAERDSWDADVMWRERARRLAAVDVICDLQDQLNDAGLVIVPAEDWEAGQQLIEDSSYL